MPGSEQAFKEFREKWRPNVNGYIPLTAEQIFKLGHAAGISEGRQQELDRWMLACAGVFKAFCLTENSPEKALTQYVEATRQMGLSEGLKRAEHEVATGRTINNAKEGR